MCFCVTLPLKRSGKIYIYRERERERDRKCYCRIIVAAYYIS